MSIQAPVKALHRNSVQINVNDPVDVAMPKSFKIGMV